MFLGTNTLVQAYVIPTGSMEGNLLLVDRLAYSDPGILADACCRRSIQHGDIIAFRYALDRRKPMSSESSEFPDTASAWRTSR